MPHFMERAEGGYYNRKLGKRKWDGFCWFIKQNDRFCSLFALTKSFLQKGVAGKTEISILRFLSTGQ
ncbi:hypothetical protein BZG82_03130 [Salinivibrio sp. PR5]|nr:hypothetical protein BGK46_02960 [Salinivibrio sp. DV]OOF11568.1 hypothetical protein BZG82_03130 [Salinivibrio sp. PR5]OOF27375.1 hypothetical protein BZJ18_08340 [Salinivibrio sp. IB872]OOF29785.1 hypothetical protein BZJ20_14255 [Salinivibrio proteolyticus]